MSRYASVVLVHPSLAHMGRAFTYAVPESLDVAPGAHVRVPFRGKNRAGVVRALLEEADVESVLPLGTLLGPGLDARMLSLCQWVAARYLATEGEALAAALPPRVASEEKRQTHAGDVHAPDPDWTWAAPYRGARALQRAVRSGAGGSFLWRPGSGAGRGAAIASMVSETLGRGRGAIVLVPEVRFSGEVVEALVAAFGDAVAWLGSDRPPRERYREWLALRSGAKRVAVGGRGAIFAPVERPGLLVVDDEGHHTYKERRAPRYHARSVAAERARRDRATLVLVGAPPSVETREAAASGALDLVALPRERERARRPPVTVIDRSADDERHSPGSRLLALARADLRRGRRVVLLVHRAGDEWRAIAERARRNLPSRTPARLDAASGPDALRRAAARSDLIVATPVIAKDISLDGVGLVGIVGADAPLASPELRAAEEAFATWWHAARWAEGGRVAIETRDPRHAAIAALARWDPDALWRAEAARRRELGYPPFGSLARIDVPADRADEVAAAIAAAAPGIDVLGPIRREGAAVVVARAQRRSSLERALRPLADAWREESEPMRIDIDPREVLPA